MANISDSAEVKSQYGTAGNLNARIRLHQLYSTNRLGWASWVFQNYSFEPGQTILELGCGNGVMWRGRTLPAGTRLVLSDFSEGMLAEAREATKDMGFIEYRVINAQDIPFPDGAFDTVIANHMLYHVPDIPKALAEIKRVLKPGGTLYATTMGKDNMKALVDIVRGFDRNIDFAMDSVIGVFGLETGADKLRGFFSGVETRRYPDSLHITEPQPLVDYILSSRGIGTVNEIATGGAILKFRAYITALFAEKGYVDIAKDAGILIASDA